MLRMWGVDGATCLEVNIPEVSAPILVDSSS
jgi:hypothetical protein